MSRYTELANELLAARTKANTGLPPGGTLVSMAYSEFLPLRAMVSIDPQAVTINWGHNGLPRWRGVDATGMTWFDVSGLQTMLPMSRADGKGTFYPGTLRNLQAPEMFFRDWTIDDLNSYQMSLVMPEHYIAFIKALKEVYTKRIFGRGIIPPQEEALITKLLDSGIAVWMMTKKVHDAQTVTRWNPNQAIKRDSAFYAAAEAFRPAILEFNRQNIAQAIQELRVAEASVAFWEQVYAIVAEIQKIPAHIINAAGTVATSITGSAASVAMNMLFAVVKSAWPILLVGGAVYVGYHKIKKR